MKRTFWVLIAICITCAAASPQGHSVKGVWRVAEIVATGPGAKNITDIWKKVLQHHVRRK
jgi:hypothetical protein